MGGGLSKKNKGAPALSSSIISSRLQDFEQQSADGSRPYPSLSHQSVNPLHAISHQEQEIGLSPGASTLKDLQTLVTKLQHQITVLQDDHEAVKHQLKEMITEQQQQVDGSLNPGNLSSMHVRTRGDSYNSLRLGGDPSSMFGGVDELRVRTMVIEGCHSELKERLGKLEGTVSQVKEALEGERAEKEFAKQLARVHESGMVPAPVRLSQHTMAAALGPLSHLRLGSPTPSRVSVAGSTISDAASSCTRDAPAGNLLPPPSQFPKSKPPRERRRLLQEPRSTVNPKPAASASGHHQGKLLQAGPAGRTDQRGYSLSAGGGVASTASRQPLAVAPSSLSGPTLWGGSNLKHEGLSHQGLGYPLDKVEEEASAGALAPGWSFAGGAVSPGYGRRGMPATASGGGGCDGKREDGRAGGGGFLVSSVVAPGLQLGGRAGVVSPPRLSPLREIMGKQVQARGNSGYEEVEALRGASNSGIQPRPGALNAGSIYPAAGAVLPQILPQVGQVSEWLPEHSAGRGDIIGGGGRAVGAEGGGGRAVGAEGWKPHAADFKSSGGKKDSMNRQRIRAGALAPSVTSGHSSASDREDVQPNIGGKALRILVLPASGFTSPSLVGAGYSIDAEGDGKLLSMGTKHADDMEVVAEDSSVFDFGGGSDNMQADVTRMHVGKHGGEDLNSVKRYGTFFPSDLALAQQMRQGGGPRAAQSLLGSGPKEFLSKS
ncbi:hypothetical protein CEUSTIGMA_g14.t1 [Chlamydomonas eustigma]|uniref:Uncharacterized protein n=1 Tax=Chlamydomonas eustigma TaxID=1157962 RepID=A0A250WP11_9CHLO|nr:hypothetical protein CEUSTIGMA_g14.t1 [Chlamydomonas eustigma]|eukprot:GAX72558.1 hypothetical protein CEUSTIGMA_g14.t1 [Chlamydomonas eustigma]